MATIDIGKIKPVFKGTYDNSTAYVLDDIVYYNGSSYVAKTSTTGNLPTDTTKWNVLASGSGGIWDSTLSLGSASQKLRVNSGGTALEFFTEPAVTSDFVKVGTVETTSEVASVDIQQCFLSLEGVSFDSDDHHPEKHILTSNTCCVLFVLFCTATTQTMESTDLTNLKPGPTTKDPPVQHDMTTSEIRHSQIPAISRPILMDYSCEA